jgi:hypothetical protein
MAVHGMRMPDLGKPGLEMHKTHDSSSAVKNKTLIPTEKM